MKKVLFAIVMLVVSTSFAMAQKNAKLEVQLIQMDKDWTAAELRGDVKAASAYVADDFWSTTPAGAMEDRAKYISLLAATKDTDVGDQYVVRFFGSDVAVMTHRGTVRGERDFQYRSTHVWVNRGGKWQIVAHHSSEVVPPAKAAPTAAEAIKAKEAAAADDAVQAPSNLAIPAAAGTKPK